MIKRRHVMARIKIRDLSKDQKISDKEMRTLVGGALFSPDFARFDASGLSFNPSPSKHLPVYGGSCSGLYFNIHESS